MKNLFTLLFALLAMTAANAQILKGDMNGDGQITMADANEVANTYLGAKAVEELPVYTKSQVDEIVARLEAKFEARIEVLEKGNAPAGVEAVDLGLSVKWATCNVGASKPEEYGDYFAWGETKGYSQDTSDGHLFDMANYSLWNGSSSTMKKYCTDPSRGTVDNKTVLDKEDDAASVNWGGSWRMPTRAEQDELRYTSNCTWTWTTMNGVKGYKVTSKKNGNSIFLPAAGYRYDSSLNSAGSDGGYWSSSLYTSGSLYAYELRFFSGFSWGDYDGRDGGLSVRAVCP